MKRFLFLFGIFAGAVIGYLTVSSPVGVRLARLFSLDYEIPVEVRKAEKSSMANVITARGELEPLKEIRISATIPGVLKDVRYAAGDKVVAGAVVAAIETEDLGERLAAQDAAIKDAEAHIKKTESQLAAAEIQLAAVHDLYQKNYIARHEMDQAEVAAKMARAQKEAAEAQLAQRISVSAQTRHVVGLARVIAPLTGVVTRRWVEPGATVAETAPLLTIAPGGSVKIIVNLKSAAAEKISPGMPVQVRAEALPGRDFRGNVTAVHELANFAGDEWSVAIELANPGGALKFGTPASIFFATGERREGIFIPRSALIGGREKPCVYVYESGKVRQRQVTLGTQQDGEIEVIAGLVPGEAVVVNGAERLTDGSRVRVVK